MVFARVWAFSTLSFARLSNTLGCRYAASPGLLISPAPSTVSEKRSGIGSTAGSGFPVRAHLFPALNPFPASDRPAIIAPPITALEPTSPQFTSSFCAACCTVAIPPITTAPSTARSPSNAASRAVRPSFASSAAFSTICGPLDSAITESSGEYNSPFASSAVAVNGCSSMKFVPAFKLSMKVGSWAGFSVPSVFCPVTCLIAHAPRLTRGLLSRKASRPRPLVYSQVPGSVPGIGFTICPRLSFAISQSVGSAAGCAAFPTAGASPSAPTIGADIQAGCPPAPPPSSTTGASCQPIMASSGEPHQDL